MELSARGTVEGKDPGAVGQANREDVTTPGVEGGGGPQNRRAELFTGQAVKVAETEFYQGIDTQALIAEQKLVRDARFLLASGYQAPRSIRLGVKVGF